MNSDEFAKVERCLRDAVDCAAQRVGAGSGQRSGAWTDNEIFPMRNRLLQMQENVLHKLRLGVDCSGLSEHAVNRNGELVLFSGHAYDRRCEEEIARLESEANARASERRWRQQFYRRAGRPPARGKAFCIRGSVASRSAR